MRKRVTGHFGKKNQALVCEATVLEMLTVPSQAALLADLRERITLRQGFAVATMNLDHAVKLHRDPAFRCDYAAQTHVTADGHPIVWFSRLARRPVDLVTGSDLVEPLVALCAELHAPVALLGATPDALRGAAERLEGRYPSLEIVARFSPPMGFNPEDPAADGLIRELSDSGARVCLVALGAPKQEKFAARALRRLPSTGFVSVGAGIDFVAGTQVRAPRLIRALALEWLWRLTFSPRRLFLRYTSCLAILPVLAREALFLRSANGVGSLQ